MPRYEGPGDIRSALEDEGRSKGPRVFTALAGGLIALMCGFFVFAAVCGGALTRLESVLAWKPAPFYGKIDAFNAQRCYLHREGREALPESFGTKDPTVSAMCQQYVGHRVSIQLDPGENTILELTLADK